MPAVCFLCVRHGAASLRLFFMNSTPSEQPQRRHLLNRLWRFMALLLLVLMGVVALRCLYAFRDRHPGYKVAVNIDSRTATNDAGPLRVGFARIKINPDLSDTNHPIWLAGFSQHRLVLS